jgi:hypothetical protein
MKRPFQLRWRKRKDWRRTSYRHESRRDEWASLWAAAGYEVELRDSPDEPWRPYKESE